MSNVIYTDGVVELSSIVQKVEQILKRKKLTVVKDNEAKIELYYMKSEDIVVAELQYVNNTSSIEWFYNHLTSRKMQLDINKLFDKIEYNQKVQLFDNNPESYDDWKKYMIEEFEEKEEYLDEERYYEQLSHTNEMIIDEMTDLLNSVEGEDFISCGFGLKNWRGYVGFAKSKIESKLGKLVYSICGDETAYLRVEGNILMLHMFSHDVPCGQSIEIREFRDNVDPWEVELDKDNYKRYTKSIGNKARKAFHNYFGRTFI